MLLHVCSWLLACSIAWFCPKVWLAVFVVINVRHEHPSSMLPGITSTWRSMQLHLCPSSEDAPLPLVLLFLCPPIQLCQIIRQTSSLSSNTSSLQISIESCFTNTNWEWRMHPKSICQCVKPNFRIDNFREKVPSPRTPPNRSIVTMFIHITIPPFSHRPSPSLAPSKTPPRIPNHRSVP